MDVPALLGVIQRSISGTAGGWDLVLADLHNPHGNLIGQRRLAHRQGQCHAELAPQLPAESHEVHLTIQLPDPMPHHQALADDGVGKRLFQLIDRTHRPALDLLPFRTVRGDALEAFVHDRQGNCGELAGIGAGTTVVRCDRKHREHLAAEEFPRV